MPRTTQSGTSSIKYGQVDLYPLYTACAAPDSINISGSCTNGYTLGNKMCYSGSIYVEVKNNNVDSDTSCTIRGSW